MLRVPPNVASASRPASQGRDRSGGSGRGDRRDGRYLLPRYAPFSVGEVRSNVKNLSLGGSVVSLRCYHGGTPMPGGRSESCGLTARGSRPPSPEGSNREAFSSVTETAYPRIRSRSDRLSLHPHPALAVGAHRRSWNCCTPSPFLRTRVERGVCLLQDSTRGIG